jgi:hypothetical protein
MGMAFVFAVGVERLPKLPEDFPEFEGRRDIGGEGGDGGDRGDGVESVWKIGVVSLSLVVILFAIALVKTKQLSWGSNVN